MVTSPILPSKNTYTFAQSNAYELTLLLLVVRICCNDEFNDETTENLKALVHESINWASLIALSNHHGVMPLVYWALSHCCPEALPKPIFQQLQTNFYANTSKNLALTNELFKLIELLEDANISALPFKGPVLTASVYGNMALRQFSDLDILVKQQDVLKAKRLLGEKGYQSFIENPTVENSGKAYLNSSLTPAQEIANLNVESEHILVSANGAVTVDLHWRLIPKYLSFPIDADSLWECVESHLIMGNSLPSLANEELLLFLCAHGAKHAWSRLGWISDIAYFAQKYPSIIWSEILERSRQLGGERMLLLGLALAQNLLGITLPDLIQQRIAMDQMVERLVSEVRHRLLAVNAQSPNTLECFIFYLSTRERLVDKIQCCLLALSPNARDLRFINLPSFLSFLYYFFRPIRLIQKYWLGRSVSF